MSPRHLASYLIDAASRWGTRPACRDAAGTHSYDDYLREAMRVAALLRSCGVGAGDRVCISAPKSFPLYASMFGTMMLNACYVPIDYTAPADRALRIIGDCAPSAVITTGRNLARLLAAAPTDGAQAGDDLVIAKIEMSVEGKPRLRAPDAVLAWASDPDDAALRPEGLDPSRPAYILYTSGSTGEPKGVVHTHGSATAFVEWAVEALDLGPDDIVPQVASVSFDLSVFDVFGTARRAALLTPIHETAMISVVRFCRAVASTGATILYCVPSLLMRDAKSPETGWGEITGSPLRHLVLAGEPINKQALRRLRPFIADVGLHNWYGPTETNVCTFHRIADDDLAGGDSIPIGKACPYASLDFVWDRPDSEGAGELLVAGHSVMAGYWQREAATSRVMQEDGSGTKYYRTGDFVRRNERGDLLFLGRRDRQVKVRGYRVQLDEVEATLQKHLPDAEIACALIKADGADPVLVAAIVGGGTVGAGDILRDSVANDLPLYMMPERVFVLEALPRNERGKIDYASLVTRLSAEYQLET